MVSLVPERSKGRGTGAVSESARSRSVSRDSLIHGGLSLDEH